MVRPPRWHLPLLSRHTTTGHSELAWVLSEQERRRREGRQHRGCPEAPAGKRDDLRQFQGHKEYRKQLEVLLEISVMYH